MEIRRKSTRVLAVAGLVAAPLAMSVVGPLSSAAYASQAQTIVNEATAWVGKVPYCWDGGITSGPSHGSPVATQRAEGATNCLSSATVGFDCTGLSLYAVAQATDGKVVLPHSSAQASGALAAGGTRITSVSALQPGDLVYFGGSFTNFDHAGIYLGSGQIVDANVSYRAGSATRPDGVHEEPLSWQYTFVGGVRLPQAATLPA
ncbi:MAG TPA: NlpC/P60 family protein, partial [Mycobacteriales bacterium]|nr:NlpC/P60 family protein [Mycobacteriales bacterium]